MFGFNPNEMDEEKCIGTIDTFGTFEKNALTFPK